MAVRELTGANHVMTGINGGMDLSGWLWVILAFVLVVAVAWVVIAAASNRQRSAGDDAAAILKARFARGEINQAEYEQARRLLGI